jgi:hypothetical protein
MSFINKIVSLVIILFGIRINSGAQTITFNILKKMIDSREYKDSIVNAFHFIKGAHIPAGFYVVEFETYRSPDSSVMIQLIYKDSASGCILFSKNSNLLQNIISDGQIDGFKQNTEVPPKSNSTSYSKGKYLMAFSDDNPDKVMPRMSLIKNYQVFSTVYQSQTK